MPVRSTSRFSEISDELRHSMREVEEDGAEKIRDAAKARVSVRSGDLRRAIHVENEPEGSYVVAGNKKVFYGHMVENGTVKAAPHPFLVPALEEYREPIMRMAQERLRRL